MVNSRLHLPDDAFLQLKLRHDRLLHRYRLVLSTCREQLLERISISVYLIELVLVFTFVPLCALILPGILVLSDASSL